MWLSRARTGYCRAWGENMEKLPIDYFNNNEEVFVWRKFVGLPAADGYEENIRHAIADIHNSHVALGYALIAYAESHTFGYRLCLDFCDCRVQVFFDKCQNKFNLDKSSVSRHVNVVYRFGNGKDGLRSSYRDRSFSYLSELLPLSEQDIDYCLIHCNTVAEIREYKKSLKPVATSQREETPVKKDSIVFGSPAYAFSVEQVKIPLSTSKNEYVDYDVFRGLSLKAILDRCIAAERRYNELLKEMSELSSVGYVPSKEPEQDFGTNENFQ